MDDMTELSFEGALTELERVVEDLETQEMPLEEAIALFERGQMLLKHCQDKLATAELKVQQLMVQDG